MGVWYCWRSCESRQTIQMSYFTNRVRALPVVLLFFAIFLALTSSFRQYWGDSAFTLLMCVGMALYASPEVYFRRGALRGGRKRNLAANWSGLLASALVAAAFVQHESEAVGRRAFWSRSGNGRLLQAL